VDRRSKWGTVVAGGEGRMLSTERIRSWQDCCAVQDSKSNRAIDAVPMSRLPRSAMRYRRLLSRDNTHRPFAESTFSLNRFTKYASISRHYSSITFFCRCFYRNGGWHHLAQWLNCFSRQYAQKEYYVLCCCWGGEGGRHSWYCSPPSRPRWRAYRKPK
jgi:hypothetical protein